MTKFLQWLALWGIFTTIGSLVRGWILSILWGWFIVPFGAPALGIAWAIGIAIVVNFLTYQLPNSDDERETTDIIIGWVVHTVAAPFMVLFVAWIVHAFMVA